MATLILRSAAGQTRQILLSPGRPITIGRSADKADLVPSEDHTLSRLALVLYPLENGATRALARQRYGNVVITRDNGAVAAHLQLGEEFTMPPGMWHLRITGRNGPIVDLDLEHGSRTTPRRIVSRSTGTGTHGKLQLKEVLHPRPGKEWVIVAALAGVLARRALRDGKRRPADRAALLTACNAWFGRTWSSGWLTNRVDEAIHDFRLDIRGDKVPPLGQYMLHSQLLSEGDLDTIDARLTERESARRRKAAPN